MFICSQHLQNAEVVQTLRTTVSAVAVAVAVVVVMDDSVGENRYIDDKTY